MSDEIKEYVEKKIRTYWFEAKNFKKEEMDFVDTFCKENYDNNRRLMILDLIRYKEENLPILIFNDKINFIYKELHDRLSKLETKKEELKEQKKVWKGFSE